MRALGLATLIALLSWVAIEAYGRSEGSVLVQRLLAADAARIPEIIQIIENYRRWTDPELKRIVSESSPGSKEKLHASLALLPVNPTQVSYLETRLLKAPPNELLVLIRLLRPQRANLSTNLWAVLEASKPGNPALLPAAAALAAFDKEDSRWGELGGKVAQALVMVNPVNRAFWSDALRPSRDSVVANLDAIFRDKNHPEIQHIAATDLLADYGRDNPALIAELLMVADPIAFLTFFPIAESLGEKTSPALQREFEEAIDPKLGEKAKDTVAERKARAAVALVRMGRADLVCRELRHTADPRLRSYIVNWLKPLGADVKEIAEVFERQVSLARPASRGEGGRRTAGGAASRATITDTDLFRPETSRLLALILALGSYQPEDMTPADLKRLTDQMLILYRDDPDAGIHGAAEWTLRQWKRQDRLELVDADLKKLDNRGEHLWFLNRQGQTFSVIDGPHEFQMGSPDTEPERNTSTEPLRRIAIPRRYAIATKEVTIEQFRRFVTSDDEFGMSPLLAAVSAGGAGWLFVKSNDLYDMPPGTLNLYSPAKDGPWLGVTWYGAAAYCNWLSKQEGLHEDQWCYLPKKGGSYEEGMTIPADIMERKGYRLPTEAEWEYACRAGTVTSRYYGLSTELLGNYACYRANSDDKARACASLLPNDLGFFDLLGNVYEWTQDRNLPDRPSEKGLFRDIVTREEVILDKQMRLFRGGAFDTSSGFVRSAHRAGEYPIYQSFDCGFRVARTCP